MCDVTVVTGAAGDIGAAICRRLASDGATVWALDLRPGSATAAIQVDVTDSGAVDAAFARIEEREGRIDALVNAAGGPGGARHGLDEVSDADWHAVTALNLDGVFHCTRAAVRAMKRAGGGSIVNISSGAGRTYSRTGVQAYAAAKAGVIGFTRQVAREFGPAGIRVNCVAPGLIWAAPTRIEWERMSEAARERHLEGVALGRVGEPDDIAGPVAFFLSDDARYVTGQTISVDGGAVMLG